MILQKIRDSQVAIESRLGKITTDINVLRDDQCKMFEKIKANEQAITTLVPEKTEHVSQLNAMRLRLGPLQDRADDAGGRTKRNNVQIVGILDRVEGRNPTKYIEYWLCTVVVL
ncbi:hypothetical protein NDU88_002143 [Pleurodeles waltl]|uniref:Uncharacterized protein n=1 Tax=Pleurodeles waltl TaxID=8319 RepID=A0AAV7M1J1_PLEWA|nr:hypothetical protein NDU88_002143 [Pleurodeles waltl]